MKLPSLFIGHGSPENALADNEYTNGWRAIAKSVPTPEAILCISAHWVVQEGSAVTAMARPKTIHDFYGFPQELYEVEYPAPGSPELASRVKQVLKDVALCDEWGLDHGTWSVLVQMYPKAAIPVVQLSLNYNIPLAEHYAIGQKLRALRDEGVLILGSGNLVHNLGTLAERPHDWAIEFDDYVKRALLEGDAKKLIDSEKHPLAKKAHPTNEHYLPLLYVMGAAEGEKPAFANEQIALGSVSMRCVSFGA
jgi:4,5-DOPA dioxygenase extradiol